MVSASVMIRIRTGAKVTFAVVGLVCEYNTVASVVASSWEEQVCCTVSTCLRLVQHSVNIL